MTYGVRGVTAPFLGYFVRIIDFRGAIYQSELIFLATVLATTIKSLRFLS